MNETEKTAPAEAPLHWGSREIQQHEITMGARVPVWLFDVAAPTICTVVYIHPRHRFYVVETDSGYRESFFWGLAS